jgi:hypothetical protein
MMQATMPSSVEDGLNTMIREANKRFIVVDEHVARRRAGFACLLDTFEAYGCFVSHTITP